MRTMPFVLLAICSAPDVGTAQAPGKVPAPLPRMQSEKPPPPALSFDADELPIRASDFRRVSDEPNASPVASIGGAHMASRIPRDRLYFDEPGDGSTWVRGQSYKARFESGRVTYVPFLGSRAPRDYPIELSLQGVSVGERAIPLDLEDRPARSGDSIVFDRGMLVERYDLEVHSMEQLFVFPRPLGPGDLVVAIAASTDLTAVPAEHGELRFCHELGRVTYGRATVFDAGGRSAPAETTLAGGTIRIRVTGDFLASAIFPVTLDPLITTFGVETSGQDGFDPDVAYDVSTDRYLVVFEEAYSQTDHDVYGMLVDGAGNLLGGDYVDFTTDYWATPAVANNNIADRFLVVARVSFGGPGIPREIRGRTFAAANAAMGPQLLVSAGDFGTCYYPDVGGDPSLVPPTYFCVTWTRYYDVDDEDVHARLVDASGTLVGPAPILIEDSAHSLHSYATISKSDGAEPYDTQEWNLTWGYYAGNDIDIWGAQIHWDGTVTTPAFAIDDTPAIDVFPYVSSLHDGAFGPRPWVVSFLRSNPGVGTNHVEVRALIGSSVVAGANLQLLEGSGTELEYHRFPRIDSDGSKFAVAYCETQPGSDFDFDAYLTAFDLVGSTLLLTEPRQTLFSASSDELLVGITSAHSGGGPPGRFFVACDSIDAFGYGDILGALYDAPAFQSFCSPGSDAIACPCGNAPSGPGRGCDNSAGTGGALLSAGGSPASDTVVLTATGVLPSATCFFLQAHATASPAPPFGDGVRCIAGSIRTLYVEQASGGVAVAPSSGDPSIRTRSAALGDPILSGTSRQYQVYYVDPASYACSGPGLQGFNMTNALVVDW